MEDSRNASFIQTDLQILQKHFNVRTIDSPTSARHPIHSLNVIINMIMGLVWADVCFIWFADFHAYLAVRLSRLLRKRSVVVVGGYEVARLPEIGYGALQNPSLARRVKYTLNHADCVLAVDEGLRAEAVKEIHVSGENILSVPTGYDHERFKPFGAKEEIAVTVAFFKTWQRIQLKGIDTFVKAARLLPEIKFIVVGGALEGIELLEPISSSNVELIGYLPQDMIIPLYQKASVYCQLSMVEGLPNALCEAMLCECVPVGTRTQGIISAMGETGFYARYGDPVSTASAILRALNSDRQRDARARVVELFTLERREKSICSAVMGGTTDSR
jgi:glycosyltransferase involved in cell wall biosynthesis